MQGSKHTLQIEYGNNREYFAVRVCSADMKNAYMPVGAVVVVHKQRYADNGDIVLAVLNGKLVYRYYRTDGDDLYLFPANNDLPVVFRLGLLGEFMPLHAFPPSSDVPVIVALTHSSK